MRRYDRTGEHGFTLVELLITMVILGIAVSGIAGLYYSMQVMQVQSQHYDLAVRAARSEIESLRNSGYNALVPASSLNFTSSLPAALPHDKAGTVAITQPLPDLVHVDVTVSYSDYGKPVKVILSSDIGVIGIGK